MSLVKRIRKLCGSKNTTLIGLEREVGLGRGTIRKWDDYSPSIDKVQKVADYFNVPIDYILGRDMIGEQVGDSIRQERESQGFTAKEFASAIGISEKDLLLHENEDEPLSSFIADKMMKALSMSFVDFLSKYEMYDEYIPAEFEGDAGRYEAFKAARDNDAMNEDLGGYIKTLAASRTDGYDKPLTEDEAVVVEIAVKTALEAYRAGKKSKG